MAIDTSAVLTIRELVAGFDGPSGFVRAVDGVSFDLHPGETLGIVGESGSGKTVTAMSVLGLLGRQGGRIASGSVRYRGDELSTLDGKRLRKIRGADISVVFQDPLTSLNPVITIGQQIEEVLRVHNPRLRGDELRERAVDLLVKVGVRDARSRARHYPGEFSGGMRQRAMIAMAIANDPDVLLADEPTTALDVTVQAQILALLRAAKSATRAATILITHDLGVIAEMADRVLVMYAGRIVEEGTVDEIFHAAKHPYTISLLRSRPVLRGRDRRLIAIGGQPPSLTKLPAGCAFHPRCWHSQNREICWTVRPELGAEAHPAACHFAGEDKESRLSLVDSIDASEVAVRSSPATAPVLLRAEALTKIYPQRSPWGRRSAGTAAVAGVDLELREGETLMLVGESGCGKSTLARMLVRLLDPTSGRIWYRDREITSAGRSALRSVRRHVQFVFQDPFAALDRRMTVRDALAEPLVVQGSRRAEIDRRVAELTTLVGLDQSTLDRYPREFSGGQRQRICIARALATGPEVLVLDEPVSSLDVSIQAQVINLLVELRDQLGLSMLFITHNLALVPYLADRVAVMYLGKIVESGAATAVTQRPSHPYTQLLLASAPIEDPMQRGAVAPVPPGRAMPDREAPPACVFRPRCWKGVELCEVEEPLLSERPGCEQLVACHFAEPDPEHGAELT